MKILDDTDFIQDLIEERYLIRQLNAIGQIIITVAIILIALFVLIIMINTFISKKRLKHIENEMKITNRHLSHLDHNNYDTLETQQQQNQNNWYK